MAAKGVSDFRDKYIKWFSELGKNDVREVGGKAANLGEMYNLKMPVPPGFAVTADAYKYFLEKTNLSAKIYAMLNKLEVENTVELDETAGKIQEMIVNAEMPAEMEQEILEAYETLSMSGIDMEKATDIAREILKKGYEPVFVAVRSSATAEDSAKASFAGQQETFVNIKGKMNLIEAIKKCFASLFTSRSIYYRVKQGFTHESVLLAVAVQVMVNSDKSGVIFSKDPIQMNDNIVIEAVFGLGEGIVSGRIKPDHYVISRDLKIVSKDIVEKQVALIRDSSGRTVQVKLTGDKSKSQVLTDSEIRKYSIWALELEKHYQLPQDIEFAIDSGRLYIVQTRPITTLKKRREEKAIQGKEILSGQPASPGIGSGEVKIVYNLADLAKIAKGNVLVTKMTNPDMVVTMQKSAAIVTDEGGATAHAAIVSREMGIPAVVGTGNATKVLKDGMYITVDGFNGKIYEGKTEAVGVEIKQVVETETKIKVTVDLPSFAERASKTGARSVGLVRIEGIIAESGIHPYGFLKENKIEEYERVVYKGINKIAEHFDELWIRTSDIRSDEFRNLKGAPKEIEANPMLGMHGIRAGLKYPEILKAELKAVKRLSETKQVGVMMPQVVSVEEVQAVVAFLSEFKMDNVRLGVMVETPAACQIIDELCQSGIDFISFGTNDLTQFTLAIDRGNEAVQYMYDEMHPAILRQLAHVIRVCKKYGVETSICGQAGSNKDMAEFLVKHGIDSISVNADKAGEISEFVQHLERKGLKAIELEGEVMAKLKKVENKAEQLVEEVKKVEEVVEKTGPATEQDFADVDIGIDIFAEHGSEKPKAKNLDIF
jgi:pyruvate,water dikinase